MAAVSTKRPLWKNIIRKDEEEEIAGRTLISSLERRRLSVRITLGITLAILLVGSITFLMPLIWLFVGAIKTAPELIDVPPSLLPKSAQWLNYNEAWGKLNFGLYLTNTLVITFVGWLIPIVINVLAGYALSKLRPSFGGIVLFLFLCTLLIPGVIYIIPQFLNVVKLGIYNTWWSLWLPGAFNASTILFLKVFFDAIPDELSDSAVIDGANVFEILWHIILPLSRPVLAMTTIFAVMGSWQQVIGPYLYLQNSELYPIGTALYVNLRGNGSFPVNIQFAVMAITCIPPLIFYAIFQKQIIKGINLSGFMNG